MDDDLFDSTLFITREELARRMKAHGVELPTAQEQKPEPKPKPDPARAIDRAQPTPDPDEGVDVAAMARVLRKMLEPEEFEAPTRVGAWTVTGELGRGGMGRVFLVRRPNGRTAVLKMLAPARSHPTFRTRFFHEVEALEKIDHPAVVAVLDHGEHAGRPYVVLEHAEGGDLRARMHGPVPSSVAARWVARVCAGLEAAHARGLVHRDIKPSNVFLTADGDVKLGDFGLAKAIGVASEVTMTRTLEVMGTPGYMAPEQLQADRGEAIGPHTDVYACGVMLSELVTGIAPIRTRGQMAPTLGVVEGPLGTIVQKATAQAPRDRFRSAAALGVALSAHYPEGS